MTMLSAKASDIAEITGGQLHGEDVAFSDVSTDTRSITSGMLFIALRGANFDGDQFVGEAAKKGAVLAVVHKLQPIDIPQIVVDDTRKALADIARTHRRSWQGTLFALTGSNGKTSTKELLRRLLEEKGKVLATKGNLNNDIGVPLTLLKLAGDEDYAVIEMGANHGGEIAHLVGIAEPDIVLVTNISAAHLEGFGSLEGVVKAKSEMYHGSGDAVMVINADLPYASTWLAQYPDRQRVSFALEHPADVQAEAIADDSSAFTLVSEEGREHLSWSMLGKHNIANALAAFATGRVVGSTLADAHKAWTGLSLQQGRLTTYKKGIHTIYDDTYNANPASFRAAIDVLAQAKQTLLIVGAMGELGSEHERAHREVRDYAQSAGIEALWSVGEAAKAYGESSAWHQHFEDHQQAAQALDKCLNQADQPLTVLVKGSRSAKMETILTLLGIRP
ncbi:UDP-N-acetylmuramoyl-tripeptide--D-alanyl-D-alanine ligase [Suttonella sp. R2A3]|uniref:UDP-N-acetylmuramoyl-tripeptide--D-alanyl-D- alanine ligase n=1 Tax=Suttonella sp. R2A3 TaxID=2908648 RepID=UPI001F3F7A32|nr:UDP-N-acetylmuramoyl-tripeptide--D-alanyl-D-alanine ligase [Suttonella sp. R2A3]UJF24610.1 UDP-N-acetylmuramoyl-tripeptide--D-alanyl-D-alanine ligase [Suttonella sp. R2A3]